jgi:hypothetical protein
MERNNQRLVIALASALAAALLAIAFLLGRISAKPEVVTFAGPAQVVSPPQAAATVAPLETQPAGSAPAGPQGNAAPIAPAEFSSVALPPRESGIVPASTAAASITRSTPPADQPQIAAYFNQVDRIGDAGAGDPQAFATSMIQSMSSGDFSGFDDLLAKARAQRQRLQAISPPRACVEHHRLALTLSGDSVAMMERLKAALVKGDSTALLTIASEGKTLETQANQLKTIGEAIKRQAGL